MRHCFFVYCNKDYDYGYSDPWSFSEPAPTAAPAPKVEPKPETPKPAPAPRTTDGVQSKTTSEGAIVLEMKFYNSGILMLIKIPENEKANYESWKEQCYAIAEIKYLGETSYTRELQTYVHYETAKSNFDDGIVDDRK